jgi:hypothetical protein
MRTHAIWTFVIGTVLLLPAGLVGQEPAGPEMILELDGPTLQTCAFAHRLSSCEWYHFDGLDPGDPERVWLDGRAYRLLWSGPGYRLASGALVYAEGAGDGALAGQRWVEAAPVPGRIHVSRSWADLDGDHVLTPRDLLTFEGGEQPVEDVRFLLRVRPLSGERPAGERLPGQ